MPRYTTFISLLLTCTLSGSFHCQQGNYWAFCLSEERLSILLCLLIQKAQQKVSERLSKKSCLCLCYRDNALFFLLIKLPEEIDHFLFTLLRFNFTLQTVQYVDHMLRRPTQFLNKIRADSGKQHSLTSLYILISSLSYSYL